MQIRTFQSSDANPVVQLWQRCGLTRPWNDPYKDIERKLAVQPELFLIGVLEGCVIASAMAGYDGHRGAVYYLAVDPAQRGQGHATALISAVRERLTALGCPKINIMIRDDNADVRAFYEQLDFARQDVAVYGLRLLADD